ncbi:hypothetical protein HDE_04206 [Halotydeus destructor]|nr:hypothetical protein HDE_04206 [Halotydeus destructor]
MDARSRKSPANEPKIEVTSSEQKKRRASKHDRSCASSRSSGSVASDLDFYSRTLSSSSSRLVDAQRASRREAAKKWAKNKAKRDRRLRRQLEAQSEFNLNGQQNGESASVNHRSSVLSNAAPEPFTRADMKPLVNSPSPSDAEYSTDSDAEVEKVLKQSQYVEAAPVSSSSKSEEVSEKEFAPSRFYEHQAGYDQYGAEDIPQDGYQMATHYSAFSSEQMVPRDNSGIFTEVYNGPVDEMAEDEFYYSQQRQSQARVSSSNSRPSYYQQERAPQILPGEYNEADMFKPSSDSDSAIKLSSDAVGVGLETMTERISRSRRQPSGNQGQDLLGTLGNFMSTEAGQQLVGSFLASSANSGPSRQAGGQHHSTGQGQDLMGTLGNLMTSGVGQQLLGSFLNNSGNTGPEQQDQMGQLAGLAQNMLQSNPSGSQQLIGNLLSSGVVNQLMAGALDGSLGSLMEDPVYEDDGAEYDSDGADQYDPHYQ